MNSKKWYKSKTIVSSVIAVVVALYNTLGVELGGNFGIALPPIPEWVFAIFGAFGIWGRTTANTVIK